MLKKKEYNNNPHTEDDLKKSIQYFTVHQNLDLQLKMVRNWNLH
jgi:putative NIF3 family GTP cyclohydrolase 1 type 2